MKGEHKTVNIKNTKMKPAILLSIPPIIVPKSNPHVMQNSDDEGGADVELGILVDMLDIGCFVYNIQKKKFIYIQINIVVV